MCFLYAAYCWSLFFDVFCQSISLTGECRPINIASYNWYVLPYLCFAIFLMWVLFVSPLFSYLPCLMDSFCWDSRSCSLHCLFQTFWPFKHFGVLVWWLWISSGFCFIGSISSCILKVSFVGISIWVGGCFLVGLEVLNCPWLKGFFWEVCCDLESFSFIVDLFLFFNGF